MVYYYGWERMSARAHMAVGWVYFLAAWLSMVVINGILSYMLTPGDWVTTRGFWDGFFNPTYWPSLVARTFFAMALAGLYALAVAAWSAGPELKAKLARYAGLGWVLPAAVIVPLSLLWFFGAAGGAGVPVAEILGAEGDGMGAVLKGLFTYSAASGYPAAQRGALVTIVCSVVMLLLVLFIATVRRQSYGKVVTGLLLLAGLLAMGGAEWAREDLRKPYVIGRYMFVNSIRLPAPEGVPRPPGGAADRFSLEALNRTGVLAASPWVELPDGYDPARGAPPSLDPASRADMEEAAGGEVFRLLCSACHTVDGYVAIRPLVKGKSVTAIQATLERLAAPVDAGGNPTHWSDPELRLDTWRGRRMPPFVGNNADRRALAVYLARLGGDAGAGVEYVLRDDRGAQYYEEYCSMCHAPDGDWPMAAQAKGRTADELYEALGRLPELNDLMEPFAGTDEERRAVAEYIAGLEGGAGEGR
jgi:mono/diheme cytochrome c family protein